jgi:geranylgeranyl diphosphate synthase type II
MVGGQVEDLIAGGAPGATISSGKSADTKKVASVSSVYSDTASDALTLEKIHRKKTGALLRFSIWSGACLAGATQHQLKVLSHFGEILGIAFQIADDLLDVTGDINTLGKTPGKDEAQKKLTWVRLYGIEESRKRLIQLERKGIALLSETGLNGSSNEALEALLQYAIHRQN